MLASWPMVIGALIAGVLLGILVPSPKPPSAIVAPPFVSTEKAEAKAKRELAAQTKEKDSAATKETVQAVSSQPAAEPKSASRDTTPCSQQTWPYFSATCIDRSAPAPSSFQVTNTRPADPSIALREEKTAAPTPAREARQTLKASPSSPEPASALSASAQGSMPAEPARDARQAPKAPAQATAPATPAPAQTVSAPQGQVPARASTPANPRVPDNAQASPTNTEGQVEKLRQRQTRGQPRYTRIEPPDDDDYDSPRMPLRRDGTRVYVLPQEPAPRGYWRSW
jgi:hypothetical protein